MLPRSAPAACLRGPLARVALSGARVQEGDEGDDDNGVEERDENAEVGSLIGWDEEVSDLLTSLSGDSAPLCLPSHSPRSILGEGHGAAVPQEAAAAAARASARTAAAGALRPKAAPGLGGAAGVAGLLAAVAAAGDAGGALAWKAPEHARAEECAAEAGRRAVSPPLRAGLGGVVTWHGAAHELSTLTMRQQSWLGGDAPLRSPGVSPVARGAGRRALGSVGSEGGHHVMWLPLPMVVAGLPEAQAPLQGAGERARNEVAAERCERRAQALGAAAAREAAAGNVGAAMDAVEAHVAVRALWGCGR